MVMATGGVETGAIACRCGERAISQRENPTYPFGRFRILEPNPPRSALIVQRANFAHLHQDTREACISQHLGEPVGDRTLGNAVRGHRHAWPRQTQAADGNIDIAIIDQGTDPFHAVRQGLRLLCRAIDKRSLKIVKTLRPVPCKTTAHVEFTRNGRFALVSIWDMDGALVVNDAKTLEEVKRIPMRKPSGKYNVHNKIKLSSGTCH